jgi:hypothetical protein
MNNPVHSNEVKMKLFGLLLLFIVSIFMVLIKVKKNLLDLTTGKKET